MRYAVYALIDPTRGNAPFYIGRAHDDRLRSYLPEGRPGRGAPRPKPEVGIDPAAVLADAVADPDSERIARIGELRRQGFDHTDIARIVARRLDEPTAVAVESFLIRSVYGLRNLTNRVEGTHAERFREAGDHGFRKGFDIDRTTSDADLRGIEEKYGRFYVYTLRAPADRGVIVVGTGTGRRMLAHAADAGPRAAAVARVEARVEHEPQAFALAELLRTFVHGLPPAGHPGGMVRPHGVWTALRGFDLPFASARGPATGRADVAAGMIGEGLAVPLGVVAAAFPDLTFDPPKLFGEGVLGIEADVAPAAGGAGARLKIFVRRGELFVELRPRWPAQRDWMRQHFTRLGAYPLGRAEDVFSPDDWRGPGRTTDDLNETVRRVRTLITIVNTTDVMTLPPGIRALLPLPAEPVVGKRPRGRPRKHPGS